MTRTNYETLKATVKVNRDDIIDYIEQYRDTLAEMYEGDVMHIAKVQIWCTWNSLNDEDYDERDRFAEYELCTKHLSVTVTLFKESCDIKDIEVVTSFIIESLESDTVEEC